MIGKYVSFLSLVNQFKVNLLASFHAEFGHKDKSFIEVIKCEEEKKDSCPQKKNSYDLKLNVSIWFAHTQRWDPYMKKVGNQT